MNLMKSFFSTRSRMVARKPVSKSTVTHELIMENQCICTHPAIATPVNAVITVTIMDIDMPCSDEEIAIPDIILVNATVINQIET